MNDERWSLVRDRELSEAALGKKLGRYGYSVIRYAHAPGTCFPDHSHKMDTVASGQFRMAVEGRDVILEAGDMLAVSCGVVHSAAVVGDKPVVSLDGIRSS